MLKRQYTSQVIVNKDNETGELLEIRGKYFPRPKRKYYGKYLLFFGDEYTNSHGKLSLGKIHILMETKSDNTLIPSTDTLKKISKKYGIPFTTLLDDKAGLQENKIITRISTGVYMVNPFLFTIGRQEDLEEKKSYWNKLVAHNDHNKKSKGKKEKRKSVLEQKQVMQTVNNILNKASEL